jgi:hypothetical protein
MSTIDRRAWLREALETSAEPVSRVLTGMEVHECEAWLPDCAQWMRTNCAVDLNACQSVGSLHVAFCEWTARNNSVPCRRDVFEHLLDRVGVPCGDGFTQGLILSVDLRNLKGSITQ